MHNEMPVSGAGMAVSTIPESAVSMTGQAEEMQRVRYSLNVSIRRIYLCAYSLFYYSFSLSEQNYKQIHFFHKIKACLGHTQYLHPQ